MVDAHNFYNQIIDELNREYAPRNFRLLDFVYKPYEWNQYRQIECDGNLLESRLMTIENINELQFFTTVNMFDEIKIILSNEIGLELDLLEYGENFMIVRRAP